MLENNASNLPGPSKDNATLIPEFFLFFFGGGGGGGSGAESMLYGMHVQIVEIFLNVESANQ